MAARDGAGRVSSRRRFIKAAVGASFVGVSGCTGAQEGNGGDDGGGTGTGGQSTGTVTKDGDQLADTLNWMSFGGSAGEALNRTIGDPFEEKYGVQLNWNPLPSPSNAISKIKAGSLGADVMVHWNYSLYDGVQEGVFTPMDYSEMPNTENIIEGSGLNPTKSEVSFDPGPEAHFVPFGVGGNGLVWNTEQVDEPNSWDDIFVDEYSGKIATFNYLSAALGNAAMDIGIDIRDFGQSTSEKADRAFSRMEEYKQYDPTWYGSATDMQNFLTQGSAWAGAFWFGRVYSLRNDNDVPVRYKIPEDGCSYWFDTISIPKGVEGKKLRTAYKFIDYIISEEARSRYATDGLPYASAYSFDDMPSILENHPEQKYIDTDRMQVWDHKTLSDNNEEWNIRLQEIIGS